MMNHHNHNSRSSYGGKSGVWISQKSASKKRIQSRTTAHRNPNRRTFTHCYNSNNIKNNNRHNHPPYHNKAYFSQFTHHSSKFFRRVSAHLSSIQSGKDQDFDPLMGWDEVNCRPVYYGTSHTCLDFHDQSCPIEEEQEEDVDASTVEQSKKVHEMDFIHDYHASSSSIISYHPKTKVKKSYGSQINNRYRKGRLSSLANVVLENVGSPNISLMSSLSFTSRKPVQGSTNKKNKVTLEVETVGTSISRHTCNMNMDFPNSFNCTNSSHGILNSSSSSTSTSTGSAKSDQDSNTQEGTNRLDNLRSALDFSSVAGSRDDKDADHHQHHHHRYHSSSTDSKLPSRKKRKQIIQKNDAKIEIQVERIHSHQGRNLRQPTYSTSLEEAKAFFDQLDREELKIVKC